MHARAFTVIGLLLGAVSCSSGTPSTLSDAGEPYPDEPYPDEPYPDEPYPEDGWTEASHAKGATADYDRLFADDVVHRFDVAVSAADYEATMVDLSSKLSGGSPGQAMSVENPMWVAATVTHGGKIWRHVGMRYKGNSSLSSAWQSGIRKLAFRLDFDRYEDSFPATEDQRFWGFGELTFSNAYDDPSLVRDKIAADLFRAAGAPAARGAFARIYLDHGEGPVYLGLYTMIEDPSDQLLAAQFADDSGNLYKPEGTGADWSSFVEASFALKSDGDGDHADVQAAIAALHASRADPAGWRAELERTFDVAGFLRVLAMNQSMVNWDSYGCMAHNYYLYGDPAQSGRLVWIPWDLNMSLQPATRTGCFPESVMLDEVGEAWPLIRYLLDDTEYRQTYQAELQRSIEGAFALETVSANIEKAHALIAPYVVGPEAVELAPYSFLKNEADFTGSLETDADALLPHLRSRQAAVREALGL